MVEILAKGRDSYGVVSVKAEFEAEGTRIDELLRLVDIARAAGLKLTVKIGGCEAIRDLLEAKQIGVQYLVAPMVESPYAAHKFVAAKNLVFESSEQEETDFLINIETITAYENRDLLVNSQVEIDGIVFGRVDFAGSLGFDRTQLNSDSITDYIIEIAKLCKQRDKQLVMGGGVSFESLDAIRKVTEVRLDRFETRKVVFDAKQAIGSDLENGIRNAVKFELLWLKNKQNYYASIAREDAQRIMMLEKRIEEI